MSTPTKPWPRIAYAPKLTPHQFAYQLGVAAGRSIKSLRGMPYGPGDRQEAYIQGFTAGVAAEITEA